MGKLADIVFGLVRALLGFFWERGQEPRKTTFVGKSDKRNEQIDKTIDGQRGHVSDTVRLWQSKSSDNDETSERADGAE